MGDIALVVCSVIFVILDSHICYAQPVFRSVNSPYRNVLVSTQGEVNPLTTRRTLVSPFTEISILF